MATANYHHAYTHPADRHKQISLPEQDTISDKVANPSSKQSGWTANTNIMDMPNEIVREICFNIDGEFSKTLWGLSLTCRHFRNIIEEYCEPDYNLRGRTIEDPYDFMEQLRDRPQLRKLIRVVRMNYEFAQHTKHTEEEVETLVSTFGLQNLIPGMEWFCGDRISAENGAPLWLLCLLPDIETIELFIEENSMTRVSVPLITFLQVSGSINVPNVPAGLKLRNISLSYPDRLIGDMLGAIDAQLLQFPSLKLLHVHNIGFYRSSITYRCSTVEKLHYSAFRDDFNWVGIDLFEPFKALTRLRLWIDPWEIFCGAWPYYIDNIACQAHSLEVLEIYSNEVYSRSHEKQEKVFDVWPAQSSLKYFKCLKSLALTDASLVGVRRNGLGHWYQSVEETLGHLTKMLPSTLETLIHVVWDGPNMFTNDIIERQQLLCSWEGIWKAAIKEQFPSMKRVMTQAYDATALSSKRVVIWERDY